MDSYSKLLELVNTSGCFAPANHMYITCSAGGNFFRSAHCYNVSTLISTFRSEIDYIIGTFDDIHIMFNDNDTVSPANQCVESIQKFANIMEMKSGSRLVKDKHRRVGFLLAQIEC